MQSSNASAALRHHHGPMTKQQKMQYMEQRHGNITAVIVEEHMGTEADDAVLGLVFVMIVGTLILAQLALVAWRKARPKSYNIVTLVGIWLLPPIFLAKARPLFFLATWVIFSCITGHISFMATRPVLDSKTPRIVYGWFLLLHRLSSSAALFGYFIFLADVFGLGMSFGLTPGVFAEAGLGTLMLGLYYGVLGRDFAEACSDSMASTMGILPKTKEQGMLRAGAPLAERLLSTGVCAICNEQLQDMEASLECDKFQPQGNPVVELGCKHKYHEFCIKGWTIVGKKDTCPACKEKVDLKLISRKPWQRQSLLWMQLLELMRYLIVWNPLLFLLIRFGLYLVIPKDSFHKALIHDEIYVMEDGTRILNHTSIPLPNLNDSDSSGGLVL